eukprot:2200800-Amphidinium_carterae.1
MEQATAGCCWIVEKKLVHRDLKMQNILIAKETVDASGSWKYVPKIADFGLAQRKTLATTGVQKKKKHRRNRTPRKFPRNGIPQMIKKCFETQ